MRSPAKSCGQDPLPTWLVREYVDIFAPFITRLINRSLLEGTFPGSFKHAIIRPLLKKSVLNKEALGSYRPVANLKYGAGLTYMAGHNRCKLGSFPQNQYLSTSLCHKDQYLALSCSPFIFCRSPTLSLDTTSCTIFMQMIYSCMSHVCLIKVTSIA